MYIHWVNKSNKVLFLFLSLDFTLQRMETQELDICLGKPLLVGYQ